MGARQGTPIPFAVDVTSLTNVVHVTNGYEHSCALTESGEVWCWGRGDYGQVGNGANNNKGSPVQVKAEQGADGNLEDIVQIASSASSHHTCALSKDRKKSGAGDMDGTSNWAIMPLVIAIARWPPMSHRTLLKWPLDRPTPVPSMKTAP